MLAVLFGLFNAWSVMSIRVTPKSNALEASDDEEGTGIRAREGGDDKQDALLREMSEIAELIQDGATTFLKTEYLYTGIFIVVFAIVIYFTVEPERGAFYTTVPFLLGALTSILSGYIGM